MKAHIPIAALAAFVACATVVHAAEAPNWALATRLFTDKKARRIGDLLTVVITEQSTASRNSTKSTDKSFQLGGSIGIQAPLVDGAPRGNWTTFSVPDWSVDAKSGFSGKGALGNQDQLSSTIAARVMEVLPNGNLLIEGRRLLQIQGETVEFVLSGTVRPEDIGRDNRVPSAAVADAAIEYRATGSIARNTEKGLLPKLWDWINPF